MKNFLLVAMALACAGCVMPDRNDGPRIGWMDARLNNVVDRARDTILVPALRGAADGIESKKTSFGKTNWISEPEPKAEEESPAKMETPKPQASSENDDDIIRVQECEGGSCRNYDIRRRDLPEYQRVARMRGVTVKVLGVKSSVSVVVNRSPDCTCVNCTCARTGYVSSPVITYRGPMRQSYVVYQSQPAYYTYRSRWRLFGRR